MTIDGILILFLFIFVITLMLGFELITKIPSRLHTPLMSGTNAISGITLVGAIVATQLFGESYPWINYLGSIAVMLATINVFGGYLVTDRILRMFNTQNDKKKISEEP